MKTYYYYQSLRRTIIQFLDLFNDIKVIRYARDGTTVTKYVEVPLKFAGKEKTWHWIYQRKDDEMLPMMSVTLTSIDFAVDRMGNKSNKIVKTVDPANNLVQRFINPVPYNINFTLSVWTLHMSDADQIIEQILPFFTPEIYMRVNIPEIGGTFDVKVIFQSCTPDITIEMPDEERRVIMWNLDFIAQTYLFRPIVPADVDSDGVNMIKKIITKIYGSEEGWDYRGLYIDGSTETTFTSGASGAEMEAMYIKAVPSGGEYYDVDGDPYYQYTLFD